MIMMEHANIYVAGQRGLTPETESPPSARVFAINLILAVSLTGVVIHENAHFLNTALKKKFVQCHGV